MKNIFDGMYYKHQKDGFTVSFIAGISLKLHAFIQIITNKSSYYFDYPLSVYERKDETIKIDNNLFSNDGIEINITEKDISITGEIKYTELTPLRYDIMGPFKYLPMQCKHKVDSLYHRLDGGLTINGEYIDFTGGIGYIEGDSGTAFPDSYLWIQCNDFQKKACVMVSIAEDIPFMRLRFRGCICVVYINGIEYRLATYLGVKIIFCDKNRIVLEQGKMRLEIEICEGTEHILIAPTSDGMVREIHECIVCGARFRFIQDGKVLLDEYSENASFEWVNDSESSQNARCEIDKNML